MLSNINTMADAVILVGSLWILLTSKVATRTGGALVLSIIGMSSLGNLITHQNCPMITEICLKLGVAIAVSYAFWRIEARHLLKRRRTA